MKKHMLTLTMTLATFVFVIPIVSNANDGDRVIIHEGQYDTNKHYYVDKSGYWDETDHHQVFIINEGHHGYWDTKGEKRVFITVGE